MKNSKKLFATIFFGFPIVLFGQYTDQINSNRPGETMSAFAVGKSVLQFETGIYGIRENHSVLNYEANGFGLDLTLRYGFLKDKLELIADLQYQYQMLYPDITYDNKSAFRQTSFGAKYLIYDPFKNKEKKVNVYSWKANRAFSWKQFIPAVSVFAGANIVSKNNPYYFSPDGGISPEVILITQNHLGDGSWVFVTNFIADYIGTDYPSYGYIITMTKGLNRDWSGFIENQGFKSDFYSDFIVRGGLAYLLNDDLQVDASISTSVKNTPSLLYGGIGCSWRFDDNFVEKKLYKKEPKEKRTKEKKVKKEKKEKGNKKKEEKLEVGS